MARERYDLGNSAKVARDAEISETLRAVRARALHERMTVLEKKMAWLKANWAEVVRKHIAGIEGRRGGR